MAKLSWLMLMGLLLSGPVLADTFKVFPEPKLDRYRVDWCYKLNESCGRPAADHFCRLKGFKKARQYEVAHNIGLTRVMSDGYICRHKDCDGFKFIQCW